MQTGYKYRVQTDRFGNALITRLYDKASVYLQGDDAVEIESQLDALNATAEKGYPHGTYFKSSGNFARIRQSKKKAKH